MIILKAVQKSFKSLFWRIWICKKKKNSTPMESEFSIVVTKTIYKHVIFIVDLTSGYLQLMWHVILFKKLNSVSFQKIFKQKRINKIFRSGKKTNVRTIVKKFLIKYSNSITLSNLLIIFLSLSAKYFSFQIKMVTKISTILVYYCVCTCVWRMSLGIASLRVAKYYHCKRARVPVLSDKEQERPVSSNREQERLVSSKSEGIKYVVVWWCACLLMRIWWVSLGIVGLKVKKSINTASEGKYH